jgi:hypothetical protein
MYSVYIYRGKIYFKLCILPTQYKLQKFPVLLNSDVSSCTVLTG